MIPISRPSIRRRDMDAVLTCMVSDNVGPGDLTSELASAVASYVGAAGGIGLRERHRAITVALSELELPDGAAILMDPLLPAAYHDAVVSAGLVPRYVDVQLHNGCIDCDGVEADLEGAAALIVHTPLGYVPEFHRLAEFGLPLVEDVSQGLGSHTGSQRIGSFGRYVVVGMEPGDIITAGGGTLLLGAGRRERTSLRLFADSLSVDALLPDMNAALALTQIKEAERFVHRRAEFGRAFEKALMRGNHRTPMQDGESESVRHSFPVVVEGSVADVARYARKKGVETAPAFRDTVLAKYGRVESGDPSSAEVPEERFPNARSLLLRCVQFPLYPALTSKEAATIERVLTTLP